MTDLQENKLNAYGAVDEVFALNNAVWSPNVKFAPAAASL